MAKKTTITTDGGFMRVKNFASRAVGNAKALISTQLSNREGRKADADRATLKKANSWKGAPNYNDDGSVTEAFQARSLADDVYRRRLKKGRPYR